MKKKKKALYIVVVAVIAIALSTFLIVKMDKNSDEKKKNKENPKNNPSEVVDNDKLKIINLDSNSRPYAVMINNISVARPYQSGLQDAYIVYEMIVEGGITRMMAIFKDKDTARVGSVRSARHYYLDYALENDAIFVHFGWSPQAKSDMVTLGVNNINGLYDSCFTREKLNIDYEHTAFTNLKKVKKVAQSKGYRTTSDVKTLLNYSIDEINLNSSDDSKTANEVDIKYSTTMTTSYKYNENDKLYYRSVNGKDHTDYVTKKVYTAKNIIIAYVENDDMNDEKGRQNLNNIGTGNGYYITNGYAIPITWTKTTRKSQTVYKTMDGKELNVNDGNTYIQIAPLNSATIS